MKIEILTVKENPLLNRKEFEVKVIHDAATPSTSEIRKKLAASKSIDKGTIIIDSFKSKYGSRETLGAVKVYQTKELALEIEPRHRLIKNGLIEIAEEKPKETKPKKEPEGEKGEETKPPKKEETKDEKKPADDDKPEKKEAKRKEAKPKNEKEVGKKVAEAEPEATKEEKEKPKDKKKGE